jgi:hypothetical protein
MRAGMAIGLAMAAVSVAAAQAPVSPAAARVTPGEVRAAVEAGATRRVTVASDPVGCTAPQPSDCPAPPALGGVTVPGGAADGELVVVTNAGPGVLVLRVEAADTAAAWRIAQPHVLVAGASATLVYRAADARWHVVGAAVPRLPPPDGAR